MRIFFSAGEPSGDQHAAHLIAALQRSEPQLQAEGFGGPHMRAENCRLLFELTTMAVMGFVRVLPMIAKFRRLVIQAEAHFDQSPPDAVVLIDFPGFNWWIAKAAKRRGIPVYYYLPPQLWAWAPWRIKKVRRFVDHVICGLPFEHDWYRERGIDCSWVGHPFFDEAADKQLDEATLNELRSSDRPMLAVLPGSRNNEVLRNFPVMLQTLQQLVEQVPELQVTVGAYRQQHVDLCRELQQQHAASLNLDYRIDKTSEVIEAADCCLMVSGSISLELMARGTPGIVLYRVAPLEKLAARFLQTCPYITLTNLIAGECVMPEFVSAGNPANDIRQITNWLVENFRQPEILAERQQKMRALADRAAETGASDRVARLLLDRMRGSEDQPSAVESAA